MYDYIDVVFVFLQKWWVFFACIAFDWIMIMFYIVSGGSCRSKRRAVSETKRVDELEEEKSSENGMF